MNALQIGNRTVGRTPLVIGTIVRSETLHALPAELGALACDVVEVRLDRVGVQRHDWLAGCEWIEQNRRPVLLTCRLAAEGGAWTAADAERAPILGAALERLSAIDVEWSSDLAEDICQRAREKGKTVVVSYHDFDKTPSLERLRDLVERIRGLPGAVIPKVAAMVSSQADVGVLQALLAESGPAPLCIIGMGALGTETRVSFAARGSCLTYGFLDAPSAPGQLSSADLVCNLRERSSEYNARWRREGGQGAPA